MEFELSPPLPRGTKKPALGELGFGLHGHVLPADASATTLAGARLGEGKVDLFDEARGVSLPAGNMVSMSDSHAQVSPFAERQISVSTEMGAYEAMWQWPKSSFKTLAELFRDNPGSLPSDHVEREEALTAYRAARELIERAGVERFGVRVRGSADYPQKLLDAAYPVEVLYFRGFWDLIEAPSVAIVGTRQPSEFGASRARHLARLLVQHDFTVVSGLAAGIDTEAHTAALEAGGRTIGVLGTPIDSAYPKQNRELQERIASEHLVVSQVPLLRHSAQGVNGNRLFFPERNKTMSALTDATVIVEAGETSGTRTQARAALQQGRKLFLLKSLVDRTELSWPRQMIANGAMVLSDFEQLLEELKRAPTHEA